MISPKHFRQSSHAHKHTHSLIVRALHILKCVSVSRHTQHKRMDGNIKVKKCRHMDRNRLLSAPRVLNSVSSESNSFHSLLNFIHFIYMKTMSLYAETGLKVWLYCLYAEDKLLFVSWKSLSSSALKLWQIFMQFKTSHSNLSYSSKCV